MGFEGVAFERHSFWGLWRGEAKGKGVAVLGDGVISLFVSVDVTKYNKLGD